MNKKTILAAFACFTLASCGGSDSKDDKGPANLSPKVSISASTEITSGDTLEIIAQASDPDGTITNYSWAQSAGDDLGINGLTSDTISIQPNVDSDTSFSFEVTVTDNDGSTAKATLSISVLAKAFQAPEVTVDSNYDVLEGSSIEITPIFVVDSQLTHSLNWNVANIESISYAIVDDTLTINASAVDEDSVVNASVTLTDSQSQTIEVAFTVTVKNEVILSVEQAIKNLERSGQLPALDTSDTIAGIDADDDGIRDDVAAYIQSLSITTIQRDALVNAAKNIQAALLVDATNDLYVSAIGEQSALSAVCLALSFEQALDAQRYLAKLEALTANTPERVAQYEAYNAARHGSVTRLPDFSACM